MTEKKKLKKEGEELTEKEKRELDKIISNIVLKGVFKGEDIIKEGGLDGTMDKIMLDILQKKADKLNLTVTYESYEGEDGFTAGQFELRDCNNEVVHDSINMENLMGFIDGYIYRGYGEIPSRRKGKVIPMRGKI